MHEANAIRNASEKQAAQMVRENLAASDTWLIRGLLAIFKRQTSDEQTSEHTKYRNDIGFNGLDAPILSSFAKQARRWYDTPESQRKFRSPLSPKQMALARRKMAKYAGQLARIARETAS